MFLLIIHIRTGGGIAIISLVLIFQTQMRSIINNVFKTINSGVNEVKLK